MKALELTGQRFGRLVVVERRETTKSGTYKWMCKCDCGRETICIGRNLLRSGGTKSCGCLALELRKSNTYARKPEGEASGRSLYYQYQNGAKNRNLEFDLSIDEFLKLTKENCHYCGIQPKQKYQALNCYGAYIYNGVDRVKNKIGYTLSNCVSCCKICNTAKNVMSYEEFVAWLDRLITFRGQ